MNLISILFVAMIGVGTAQARTQGKPFSTQAWKIIRTHLPEGDSKVARLVLMDIWASWCGPCRESFPHYEEIYRRWQKEGLVVIGLNMDSQRDRAEEFLRDVPVSFPIIYDQDKKLREMLAIETLPRLYILDEYGNILQMRRGSTQASRGELDLFLSNFFKTNQKLINSKETK